MENKISSKRKTYEKLKYVTKKILTDTNHIEKIKNKIRIEYENRDNYRKLKSEYNKILTLREKECLNKIERYMEKNSYNNFSVENILSFDLIKDTLAKYNKNKTFLILLMQYQRISKGKKFTSHFEKFDWFYPVEVYSLNWFCSFCAYENKLVQYKRTYNRNEIFKVPCKKCKIIPMKYRELDNTNKEFLINNNYLYSYEIQRNKIESIEKYIDINFSKTQEVNDFYSINDQYLDFKKNEDILPQEVRKFIDTVKGIPDKKNLEHDFSIVLEKSTLNFTTLKEFNIVKEKTIIRSEFDIAISIINNLNFRIITTGSNIDDNGCLIIANTITCNFKDLKKRIKKKESFIILESYLNYFSNYVETYIELIKDSYLINKFFFEIENKKETNSTLK